jgi:hypothetical protein
MSDIDNIIKKLFSERWTENLANADIQQQREQLYKTLRDQASGYWSGHTAYYLAVDGGFLIDSKRILDPLTNKAKGKKLTLLGELFIEKFTS